MLIFPQVIVDLRRDLGCSLFELSRAANIGYFAFGLGALPAGWLADRLGSRRVLVGCAAGLGVGAILVAAAENLATLTFGMTVLGLSASVYHPAGLALLMRGVDGRGRRMGLHGVGGNLGEAVGPALAAATLAVGGWPLPYAVGALLAGLALGLVLRLPPDGPAMHPQAAGAVDRVSLALVLGIALCAGFAYRGVITFLPLYARERFHAETTASGSLLTSALLGAGVLSQWIGGRLADRAPRGGSERLFFAMLLAPFVSLLALVQVGGSVSFALVAMLFGFFWFGAQPLQNALPALYAPSARHGSLYGVIFFVSFGLGSVATSAGGWIAERRDVGSAFALFAAVVGVELILAGVLALRASRRGTGAAQAPGPDLLSPF